ncbi:MAG TPA: helix-turn-helix domain-containing protein [Vicinamibacteria bacterium]|nr:helix-turn-helix domain-containing protein [Vicinamibacteria bacterium]
MRARHDGRPQPALDGAAARGEEVPLSVHERLLNAARERFATEGYENATTASIARQAGTSESQLVKHFGSKEGLLEAIFDEAWSAIETQARHAIAEQPAPLARLLAVSDLVIRSMERDRKLRSLVLLEGRRIRKNGYEVVISAGFRRFLAVVDDLFRQMQEQGDFIPDVHLEAVRSAWMGALEGMVRDQLLAEMMGYPATFTRKVVRRTSLAILTAFLAPRAQRMAHALAATE